MSVHVLSLNVSFFMHFLVAKSKIQAVLSFPAEIMRDLPGLMSIVLIASVWPPSLSSQARGISPLKS
jgi:hypothetical protein